MTGNDLLAFIGMGALVWCIASSVIVGRLLKAPRRYDDTVPLETEQRRRAYRRRERRVRGAHAAYLARVERGLAIKAALAQRERGGARG